MSFYGKFYVPHGSGFDFIFDRKDLYDVDLHICVYFVHFVHCTTKRAKF